MLDQVTRDLIAAAEQAEVTPDIARRLVSMVDLTALDPDADTPDSIAALCRDSVTRVGPVAAVCVLPRFVAEAKAALAGSGVKVATVVDFPDGNGTPEDVMRETEQVLAAGAEEIDLVFPYRRFLAEEAPRASANIRAVRAVGGYDIRLKAILEAGAFPDLERLAHAADVAIQGGADFLKTSTGKHAVGARLADAAILLGAIDAAGLPVGFKAAGGIRTPAAAASFLALAESMLSPGWATPQTFRIGASTLLPALLRGIA